MPKNILKPEYTTAWVEELTSGKWAQAFGRLRPSRAESNCRCTLGVFAEALVQRDKAQWLISFDDWEIQPITRDAFLHGAKGSLPYWFLKEVCVDFDRVPDYLQIGGSPIYHLNDIERRPFSWFAEHIAKHGVEGAWV